MLGTIRLDREVFLASRPGRIRVHVETNPDIHPRAVIYRRGDWMQYGGGANKLIESKITDLGECAVFYSQHVRLENRPRPTRMNARSFPRFRERGPNDIFGTLDSVD